MIVRWPTKIEANSKSEHISAFWDVMPTLADISGGKTTEKIDGISFLPELTGKKQKEHVFLYWEFHEQGGKKAVRKGKWKAVKLKCFNEAKTRIELYDLSKDVGEENDIASDHPEIVKELVDIMERAHVENEDFPFTANVANNY